MNWIDTHPVCQFTGKPLSEIPVTWAQGEPDNKENKESCMTLNGDGDLSDQRCEEPRPYICYQPEKNQVLSRDCGTVDPGNFL